MQPAVFAHPPFESYALLDSGTAEKLERFGGVVLRRPDPQALWRPRLPERDWARADWSFERESDRGGRWVGSTKAKKARGEEPGEWELDVLGARLLIRPTPFKHVGLFPEQAANWAWLRERAPELAGEEPPRLLNLFGYSGAASIIAARAGYRVTHVDASRASIAWAKDNAELSGASSIRFLVEDAPNFTRRAVRRGDRYEAILVDPPHYGRGPRGEKWQLETGLAPLIESCASLLAQRSLLILSTYSVGFSPLAFLNLFAGLEGGVATAGELVLPEEPAGGRPGRLLPCGFCARWQRGLGGAV